MTFKNYQTQSAKTASYKNLSHPVIYPITSLADEIAEINLKKVTSRFDQGAVKGSGDNR